MCQIQHSAENCGKPAIQNKSLTIAILGDFMQIVTQCTVRKHDQYHHYHHHIQHHLMAKCGTVVGGGSHIWRHVQVSR